ncbi:DUF1570 domain-containing protein [Pseudoalteromonas sp. T1lg23B]|uniref:DUF1570 domain-containing protein n=1 Tax=Pseudoalteromonas sp. T1lg23B TaxID=2077097 RepID=UPI001F3BCF0C|nr:DUF1570 domain-containing protein [Pseudoalteromonas sp. T1lg23B]
MFTAYFGEQWLGDNALPESTDVQSMVNLEQGQQLSIIKDTLSPPSSSESHQPIQQVQCDMAGFVARQAAASRQHLDSLAEEFSKVQHVFGSHSQLTVYHKNITTETIDMLIERLALVHHLYGQLLGERAYKSMQLNLVILSNRAEYEDYTSRFGFDPRASQGVFFHGSNSAFIEYKNDEQVIATAVHEAIHAMNLRLIGLTPRWLNEGMAQLFEGVSRHGDTLTFNVAPRTQQKPPYDIYALLESESQWGSVDMGRLYYSGWSWLSYIVSNDSTMAMLAHLLGRESTNPCDVLGSDESYDILQRTATTFEQDFHDWFYAAKPER